MSHELVFTNMFECELFSISELHELFSTRCNSKTVYMFTMRCRRSQNIKIVNSFEFYLKLLRVPVDNKTYIYSSGE